MGMYTEIFARGGLAEDTPPEIGSILRALIVGVDVAPFLNMDQPHHQFFDCDRFNQIASGSSAYLPGTAHSQWVEKNFWSKLPGFLITASLKNYDSEIEKFFDWIDPYLEADGGEFVGYSLYEENRVPLLFYKGGLKPAIGTKITFPNVYNVYSNSTKTNTIPVTSIPPGTATNYFYDDLRDGFWISNND